MKYLNEKIGCWFISKINSSYQINCGLDILFIKNFYLSLVDYCSKVYGVYPKIWEGVINPFITIPIFNIHLRWKYIRLFFDKFTSAGTYTIKVRSEAHVHTELEGAKSLEKMTTKSDLAEFFVIISSNKINCQTSLSCSRKKKRWQVIGTMVPR